jgi:hypothetical protein
MPGFAAPERDVVPHLTHLCGATFGCSNALDGDCVGSLGGSRAVPRAPPIAIYFSGCGSVMR